MISSLMCLQWPWHDWLQNVALEDAENLQHWFTVYEVKRKEI